MLLSSANFPKLFGIRPERELLNNLI
jgi:hypothetical protein